MTKTEFLADLRERLNGEVSANEVEKSIRYYEGYISDEIAAGKKEAQVMDELGSPFLIAKTIIDTAQAAGQSIGQEPSYTAYRSESTGSASEEQQSNRSYHIGQIPGWVLIVILVLAIVLIFTILRALLPILLPVILVCFVLSMLKRRS